MADQKRNRSLDRKSQKERIRSATDEMFTGIDQVLQRLEQREQNRFRYGGLLGCTSRLQNINDLFIGHRLPAEGGRGSD